MERNDRRLVIALASALGLSLLAIAFLLGRISARPAAVALATPVPSEGVPSAAPILTEGTPAALPEGVAPTDTSSPPSSAPAFPTPAAAPPAGPGAPASGDRQSVAAYFAQVDRLEEMGGGDPQAFASSLLESMTSGDFTAFDDLLAKARNQRQRLQAIAPPRSCAEHHRLALSLTTESVAMLERIKAALMKGDSMALMTIASEGRILETQANQLKTMGETIKRLSGV